MNKLKNFSVRCLDQIFDHLIIILYEVFKVHFSVNNVSFTDNGDGEIRTLDPLLARQVLSQLSYAPV